MVDRRRAQPGARQRAAPEAGGGLGPHARVGTI